MKRVKIGGVIVVIIVTLYFLVSYGIFWVNKSSLDKQLALIEAKDCKQNLSDMQKSQEDSVVIQGVKQPRCTHNVCSDNENQVSGFIVTNDEQDVSLPQMVGDDAQQEFIMSADSDSDALPEHASTDEDSYSFITMPLSNEYQIDQDTQDVIDVLIGNNVDEFVKLILQSNNNIVSKEACRSCSMYAFFNRIQQHKSLTVDDVRMLQNLLANLYQFVRKMKNLSHTLILLPEQYDALKDLHRSQAVKNDIKLKKRQAVISTALKKLQNIKYNK